MKSPIFVVIAVVAALFVARLIYLSQTSQTSQTSQPAEQAAVITPVITTQQLLSAADVKAGVIEAIAQDKPELIDRWVQRMLDVAVVAQLPSDDIDYLQSAAAREYLIFNAKRELFNREFEQRFYQLKDISGLEEQYPEAKDLFAKAQQLVIKRDSIIVSLATTLAAGQEPSDEHFNRARIMWRERYQQNTD